MSVQQKSRLDRRNQRVNKMADGWWCCVNVFVLNFTCTESCMLFIKKTMLNSWIWIVYTYSFSGNSSLNRVNHTNVQHKTQGKSLVFLHVY